MPAGKPGCQRGASVERAPSEDQRAIGILDISLRTHRVAIRLRFADLVLARYPPVFGDAAARNPSTVRNPELDRHIQRRAVDTCLRAGDDPLEGHGLGKARRYLKARWIGGGSSSTMYSKSVRN